MIFAALGVLKPEKRGSLLFMMILLFVFMGVFNGYYSARIYKMFQGSDWLKNSLLTTFLYPALSGSIFLLINTAFCLKGSSATV
jgi:transmembrane 9 superfamily protein 2/4